MKQRGYVSRVAIMLGGIVLLSTSSLASDKYQPGKQFADSLKGSGVGHLQGFKPEAVIPNYNANPQETGHYGGVTASGSGGLENVGAGQLNTSEVGKVTTEVIMNRPKDPISMDAPFVSGGFDIQDKAETVTNGTFDKCETVNVGKTEITTHHCERETAVELSCTRKAHIGGVWQEGVETKSFVLGHEKFRFGRSGKQITFSINSPDSGPVISASLAISTQSYLMNSRVTFMNTTFNMNSTETKALNAAGIVLTKDQQISGVSCSGNGTCVGTVDNVIYGYLTQGKTRFTLTLNMQIKAPVWVPKVEWTETCPFDKSDEVLQNTVCTEAGGTKNVVMNGVTYPVYSDCWAYKDVYLSQAGDNGTCGKYMNDTACTVSKTTCIESLGAVCLREQAVFTCEKKISGEAQLCSGQLVCANGECDQLENNKTDSFGKAVSALAAVTAAAKDVSDLNGVDVRAFTGEKKECRMAIAGFNNCCKDSGWGQGIGLAHCDSEEKALGKAKEKQLTVSVGTYCSKKVLGVCLQKKKSYCQFDSKLAQIVQAQGRKGQLGINFGSGKSPNCRGITIDELQALRFDNMDFSNFYSDLDAGTTVPADSELADRVKAQIEAALQQAAGKGGVQ